ncbi:MAG: histidine phosphatase family protein [Candidatus Krumholzibacteria bacterium]|nr:histidine phosphatase family protein [Candidatus Krumholzibacteria bacterium]
MKKTIYLVRHAHPMPPHLDPDRGLSEVGRREAIEVTERLTVLMGEAVERIFHSGKLRARQTAEIIGSELSPLSGLHEVPGLLPDDDVGLWVDELADAETGIMLVGHMPFMAFLRNRLTGETFRPFVTAEVSCLESSDDGNWSEKWNLFPRSGDTS